MADIDMSLGAATGVSGSAIETGREPKETNPSEALPPVEELIDYIDEGSAK
ncbi:hypothetical protein FRC03_012804 [Tulasnella sp. 419]|nr:hypothetical protein FRC03_012804 [Tulasnella sp. 419]